MLPGSLVPVLSSIFRLNMLLNTGTKHVKFENVWSNIQDGMKRLFVANTNHTLLLGSGFTTKIMVRP